LVHQAHNSAANKLTPLPVKPEAVLRQATTLRVQGLFHRNLGLEPTDLARVEPCLGDAVVVREFVG
jgi:hypothetical protein